MDGGGVVSTSGFYGAGGGRQIPGAQTTNTLSFTPIPGGTIPATTLTTLGGGPSQNGSDITNSTPGSFLAAGGGGGWGARGGNAGNGTSTFSGAAGGRAINTNGNAVTWISGSNRAYGAIG